MAEISDERLAQLLRAEAGMKVVDDLWRDPETGPALKAAVKRKHPEAPVPEIDLVEPAIKPLASRLDAAMKEIEALKTGMAEKEAQTALVQRLDAAAAEYGLTPAGRKRLEQFMLDTATPDPHVAAAALIRSEPALTGPAPSADTDIAFDPKARAESDELLFRDPAAWAKEELLRGLSARK